MWFGPGRSICPPRTRACRGIKSGRMGGLIDLALIAASTCFNICYNMLQHAMLQPTRRYVRSRYVCTWLYVIYCNWMGLSIWIGIWNGSKIITIALGSNLPRNFNPRAHIETDGDSMGDSRLALHVSPVQGASYGRQMMCIVLLTFWDVYDSYDCWISDW